jgi:hypothetical protein
MDTPILLEERLARISSLPIKHGAHEPPKGEFQGCVMELVSFVAGEPWSDTPQCVCPVIGQFMRTWNDSLPDDESRTRLLKPLIPKILNTRSTPEIELARVMLCVDWVCREFTPAWLDMVPALKPHADTLRELRPVQSWDDLDAILSPLRNAQGDANAARAAARAAARDALKPTMKQLQLSAVALVERMAALK